jgi:predicted phage gp36 major capsid-like protein
MNDALGQRDNIDPALMIDASTNWAEALSASPDSPRLEDSANNRPKTDGRKRKLSEVAHMEDLRESMKERWKEEKKERELKETKLEERQAKNEQWMATQTQLDQAMLALLTRACGAIERIADTGGN